MSTLTSNLHLQKGVDPDNWRTYLKTNLADSLDILDKAIGQVANVKGYGATGDGTTDDRAAILAAEAALGAGGGTLCVPAGTYAIGASMTLAPTTNLLFWGGASLAPAASTTTTIAGTVQAGLHQIFSGAGAIVVSRAQPIYPEWWGAVADVKTRQGTGSMTSGSATLATSGSPAFASTDVGKIAVVLGAGAAGVPLVTTIAAYTDAGHVTLAVNASSTVSSTRWAIGSDSTTAINACLACGSATVGAALPVRLSGLYGVSCVLVHTNQVLEGSNPENVGFYRLAAGTGVATVSLASGSSGDGVRLSGFVVNNMFQSTYDGIEIGTGNAAWALASGGVVKDVKVRNAAGWAFNIRCNVARFDNLWSQHDNALPSANTTAGGHKHTDTIAYATSLSAEGNYPAGCFALGAGAGSVYDGLQMELTGTHASTDCITVNGSQISIRGVFATVATMRDLIRIPTAVREVFVENIRLSGSYTLTNVVNDVDRSATIVSTGTDAAYLGYWTANVLTFAGQLGLLDLTGWTPYAPTWTGFSVNPTVTSRYKQIGKTVVWSVGVTSNGTSNAIGLTATLPVTAAAARMGAGYALGNDNGVALSYPVRIDLSSTTVATFYASPNGNVWTNVGPKAVFFTLVYEAA